jgi:hypothetical protein
MAHKHRCGSTPLEADAYLSPEILGLKQTNTFTFNRYAVKRGRLYGPGSEKLKEGQMVAKKKVSGRRCRVSGKTSLKRARTWV